ncbi:hypothetical protein SAMN05216339_101341 [Nitrosomonas eutropha]|uniref:TIGR04255 family protein n=1 Tax=Nitrosomonas eutropha TaxID=916 RepID=A0A1I7F854_9PROT|nr:hypothetical protein [Nitrosomonas eutropha]SFU32344.1 hypothetical protein SAMN05216339_101341 [Nitrosomonas eutropha]
MKTRLLTIQFALFFRDIIERPDTAFSGLNERMINLFDGMPSMLPVPRELPPEIPIVTLRSEKDGYSCNISRSRIDLLFSRSDDKKQNKDIFKDFNIKVAAFSKYVFEKQDVIRFGLIARYFKQDNDAVSTIRKKYFSNAVESVAELSLRYNAQSSVQKKVINDVVEIGANQLIFNGQTIDGVLVQRDINNAPVVNELLSLQELEKLSTELSGRISEEMIEALIS